MQTYTVKHYRRQAPHDSAEETLITSQTFGAENDTVARTLTDALLEGFNRETDFAVLTNAKGEIVWRAGAHL